MSKNGAQNTPHGRANPGAPLRVVQVVDTLEGGGMERVAVNLANLLPRSGYETHLCTTRSEGVLADSIAEDVGRLRLGRRWRYDIPALMRLSAYNRANQIAILHAHSAAVFLAALASALPPYPAVVWHLHRDKPSRWPYWFLARRVRAVIAVTRSLAAWAVEQLGIRADRVRYIPNFSLRSGVAEAAPELPGRAGTRLVCLANLRPEKDHLTLIRAMEVVVRQIGTAHLLIVGPHRDPVYSGRVQREIAARGLTQHVTLLGERQDVVAILRSCDIGVLSSLNEGFPLALVEYGLAGLPAVATSVGECAGMLDHGGSGIVVPPGAPGQLADALLSLLRSPARRVDLGESLRRRVETTYSSESVLEQVCSVYEMAHR